MSKYKHEKVTQLDGPVVSVHSGIKASNKAMTEGARPRLYAAINENGGHAVMTKGKRYLDEETGEFQHHYRLESGPQEAPYLQQLGRTVVHSARDYSRKLDTECFPYLNIPSVRELCTNKEEFYKLWPSAQPEAVFLNFEQTSGRDEQQRLIDEALDGIETDKVVAKPSRGSMVRNIFLGSKTETQQALLRHRETARQPQDYWMIQTALNTQQEIPGIYPASEQQREKLAHITGPRELRTYVLDTEPVLTTLRAANLENTSGCMGEKDLWIFLDQDYLPSQAIEQAVETAKKIRLSTGAVDSLVAVDQIYDQDQWWLLEVNHEAIMVTQDPEREQWYKKRDVPVACKLVSMGHRPVANSRSHQVE